MSQKKYLLTGASGFLGHHLVHQLVVDGASVSIFDLHPPGSSPTDPTAFRPAEHFQLDAEQAERVSYIKGSILEEEKLEAACEGVDGVFHLAGIVKHSRDNPHPPTVDFAWKVNVDGTYAVFRAVAKAGSRQGRTARIVYASSSGCVACQKKKPGPTTVGPGGDSSPFCEHVVRGKKHGKYGKFPYYAAKIEVEKVGMPLALELGLEVVWMRPTMMLGPGDHLFRSTGLIVSFLKGSIPMVPCGGASFLDVRDSAAAFKTAMELPKLPRPNPTYVLGSHNCTIKGFFRQLEELTGVRSPTIEPPYILLHAAATFLYRTSGKTNTTLDPVRAEMGSVFWDVDWRRAAQELDFKPRDPTQTLKDTIDYVRSHHPHPKVNGTKPSSGPKLQWLPRALLVAIVAAFALRFFRRRNALRAAQAAVALGPK